MRLLSIASTCSVLAVLVNGLTDYVFYNSRIFFLFFVVVGIGVALARVGRKEEARRHPIKNDGAESFTIDIDIA